MMEMFSMITEKEYISWMRNATKKEITFVNTYLKTLDAWEAFQEAGYNYKHARCGKWKVFTRLLPYIQYKLQKENLSITREFIVSHWLAILSSDDTIARQNALKELTKLFGYADDSTKVNIENNIPSVPVQITFTKE